MAAITKEKEFVVVAANMLAEEFMTILHKPMKVSTLGRTRVLSSVTLGKNMGIMQ